MAPKRDWEDLSPGLGAVSGAAGAAVLVGHGWFLWAQPQREDNCDKGCLDVRRSSCAEGLGGLVEGRSVHITFPILWVTPSP